VKNLLSTHIVYSEADPGGAIGAIAPPKTYESNIFHHDFVQFRKTFGWQRRLDCQILLKSPHPKLTSWIRPWADQRGSQQPL